MSNEHAEEYDCDQPWNPVSYFEEENEATGKNFECRNKFLFFLFHYYLCQKVKNI